MHGALIFNDINLFNDIITRQYFNKVETISINSKSLNNWLVLRLLMMTGSYKHIIINIMLWIMSLIKLPYHTNLIILVIENST